MRVEHARRDHGVGSAESVQKRNQHQASGGRARQIEKIGAVHALDGFGHGDRNHRPGEKERQRAGDVNGGQRAVSQFAGTRQNEPQRRHHAQRVGQSQHAELRIQAPGARHHHVGKHAARAQSEERDRNRQEREVVIKHHRENARERQLQDQRGERGDAQAQIQLVPAHVVVDAGGCGSRGCGTNAGQSSTLAIWTTLEL